MKMNIEEQARHLSQGAQEVLPSGGLQQVLQRSQAQDRPLRIKLGIDPTTSKVHIGHMVPYRKLRQFQDMGHTAVLIIGDFTAMIGDPTGKHAERLQLSFEEVRRNARDYCEQIFTVVDRDRAEIRYQSEWFGQAGLADALQKASRFSLAHLLSHETFRHRLESGGRLGLHELFYPVLQAWDSVEVNADVELGGMDQKFNVLCGRDLQRALGYEQQSALFLPLLPGTNGEKMSKTAGNHISVQDTPSDMYGKIMSISDDLIPAYLQLASWLDEHDIESAAGDPYVLKHKLAENIVARYHGDAMATEAAAHFRRVISRGAAPDEMPALCIGLDTSLLDVLLSAGVATSTSEGRRLVQQGAIRVNGDKIRDHEHRVQLQAGEETTLQAGKRRWFRLVCKV